MSAKAHYSPTEQIELILQDLRNDIACAERQAAHGPYYPDRGITADSLRQSADHCRNQIGRILHRVNAPTGDPIAVVNQYIAGKI